VNEKNATEAPLLTICVQVLPIILRVYVAFFLLLSSTVVAVWALRKEVKVVSLVVIPFQLLVMFCVRY
jgi:hypothetical protein